MKTDQNEKFLLLICGLPGTGKTTSARILASKLAGYILIEQNEVRRKHGVKKMPKTQEAVLRKIDQLTAENLRRNHGVIYESGNRYSFRRHQMYGIASSCGRRVIVLEVVCSEDTSKERIRTRPAGDGLISDPTDPCVYDRIKSLWENIEIDFKHAGEDHVSHVRFNTDTRELTTVIGRKGTKNFINKLKKGLKRNG